MLDKPAYTRLQIALHWVVAVLVALAWFTSDGMGRVLRQRVEQGMTGFDGATLHTIFGSLLLIVVLWRLVIRLRSGAPASVGTPALTRAAELGHWALYALMIIVPTTGAAAWYAGVATAADAHEVVAQAFVILILGHVAMAIWHGVVRRDGTLRRMVGRA